MPTRNENNNEPPANRPYYKRGKTEINGNDQKAHKLATQDTNWHHTINLVTIVALATVTIVLAINIPMAFPVPSLATLIYKLLNRQ